MKAFTFSAAAIFTTLAAALPASMNTNSIAARDDEYYARANLVARDDTPHELSFENFSVQLGVLYSNPDIKKITSITLQSTETNLPSGDLVDVNKVECMRYKDQWATQPGSARFSGEGGTASISTNPVELGYILCYRLPNY